MSTKGQASPTSDPGFVTKAQPEGVHAEPFNPVETAVALRANFVARGFAGMPDHPAGLIRQAPAETTPAAKKRRRKRRKPAGASADAADAVAASDNT